MLFSFPVVIDHANNSKASTGEFECVYRQPTTPLKINKIRAQTLQINGTAIPIHLQSDEKLLDKNPLVDSSSAKNLNIFNELDSKYYKLNVIKETDKTISLNVHQDNKRDAFKSFTETNTKTERDYNKYLDLKIDQESCAYITRTKLKALTEANNGNKLDLSQEKVMSAYIIDTEPNVTPEPYNGRNLDGYKKKEKSTYCNKIKLNSLTEQEETFWTWVKEYIDKGNAIDSAIRDPCVTQTEPKAVTKQDSKHLYLPDLDLYPCQDSNPNDNMDLNKHKEMSAYMIHGEPNTIAELDNDKHFNLMPEDDKKSETYNKTQIDTNASLEPNKDDHLVSNPNTEPCAYVIRTTPKAIPERDYDNHLEFKPDQETSAYSTRIEPDAMAERDNCKYFDLTTEKDIYGYIAFINSTTTLKQDNDDHFDFNPENDKKTCAYMAHVEPNATAKLNNGDHLYINLETEICSMYVEPNITTGRDNDDYLDFNPDNETCEYMTHTEPIAIKEMDVDDNLEMNQDKETYSYMKAEIAQSNKFYLTSSMAPRLALWAMSNMRSQFKFPRGPI